MNTHFNTGKTLLEKGKTYNAILELEKGLEYSRELGEEEKTPEILLILAKAYNEIDDDRQSLAYARTALKYYDRKEDLKGKYEAKKAMAQNFIYLNKIDSAIYIYKNILNTEDFKDSTDKKNILVDYGIALYRNHRFKEAQNFIENGLDSNRDRQTSYEMGILAEILAHNGYSTRVSETIDTLTLLTDKDKAWYFLAKRNCARVLGDYEAYNRYADSTYLYELKFKKHIIVESLDRDRRDTFRKELITEKNISNKKLKRVITLILISGLLTGAVIYISVRINKRKSEEERKAREWYEKYKDETAHLTDMLAQVKKNEGVLEIYYDEIKKTYGEFDKIVRIYCKDVDSKVLKNLIKTQFNEIINSLRNEDRIESLRKILDKENEGILEKMEKEKCLNKKEITMLTFSLNGFSPLTISLIMDLKVGTVYNYLSKLKQRDYIKKMFQDLS